MISPQKNADNVPNTKKGPKGTVLPFSFLRLSKISMSEMAAPLKNEI